MTALARRPAQVGDDYDHEPDAGARDPDLDDEP